MKIVFEQKLWFLIVLVSFLLATAIVLLMYFRNKDNRELSRWQQRTLMALRFLTIFTLSFLFTVPLVKTLKRITEYPEVILAIDNSLSMKGLPGTRDQSESIRKATANIVKGLEDKFKIITYTFGEKTIQHNNPDFGEKWSDYSQMLQTVYDNHFNENMGALVIVGDGNYNQGENPQNIVKKFHFPIYTLGTGDTTQVTDGRITDIRVNKTAFEGNQFPVEADIRVTGFQNVKLLFTVSHDGKQLFSRKIEVNSPDFFTTLSMTLEASQKGLQSYTAMLEAAPEEKNLRNNSWPFIINILENKQKVLILSEGSHPDIGAIKNSLEQQINYEISLFTAEPYPADLNGYSLIILNQLPSSSQSCRQIMEQSQKYRIPLLFIIGSKTMLQQMNMLGLGIQITPQAGDFDEAQVALNEQFVSFTLSNDLKEKLAAYPPLKVPFAQYSMGPGYREIAFQRVKNIATSKPLMAVGTVKGIKSGIIFGEGIWRWRLYNYIISGNHIEFDELTDKLVQYLALRDNEDNFRIDCKPVYMENENIQMSAEVYNDAYELIHTPEVMMTITDSTKREFRYSFDHGDQFYRLDAGIFPPGRYHYSGTTQIGAAVYKKTGDFAVIPVNLEQIDMQANHRILYQLAHETKGGFFEGNEEELLTRSIIENNSIKTTNYFQTILNEILNLRWIFFVFLMLLGTEWFLRKYWGIY